MLTVIIKYTGKDNNPKKFMEEMINTGIVDAIRKEKGNIRYEYFLPIDDNSVILIDSWENQEALDIHHHLPLMKTISDLRSKYDLHMEVDKYISIEDDKDKKYIRK